MLLNHGVGPSGKQWAVLRLQRRGWSTKCWGLTIMTILCRGGPPLWRKKKLIRPASSAVERGMYIIMKKKKKRRERRGERERKKRESLLDLLCKKLKKYKRRSLHGRLVVIESLLTARSSYSQQHFHSACFFRLISCWQGRLGLFSSTSARINELFFWLPQSSSHHHHFHVLQRVWRRRGV